MPRPDTRSRPHAAYSAYRRFYCQPFVAEQQYRGATQDHDTAFPPTPSIGSVPHILHAVAPGAGRPHPPASSCGARRHAPAGSCRARLQHDATYLPVAVKLVGQLRTRSDLPRQPYFYVLSNNIFFSFFTSSMELQEGCRVGPAWTTASERHDAANALHPGCRPERHWAGVPDLQGFRFYATLVSQGLHCHTNKWRLSLQHLFTALHVWEGTWRMQRVSACMCVCGGDWITIKCEWQNQQWTFRWMQSTWLGKNRILYWTKDKAIDSPMELPENISVNDNENLLARIDKYGFWLNS